METEYLALNTEHIPGIHCESFGAEITSSMELVVSLEAEIPVLWQPG